MTCKRCGLCCEQLGVSFWTHSEHPFIRAISETLGDDYTNDMGQCAMLERHANGRTSCLIQKWLGYKAKPEACKAYPFDNQPCFREAAVKGGQNNQGETNHYGNAKL